MVAFSPRQQMCDACDMSVRRPPDDDARHERYKFTLMHAARLGGARRRILASKPEKPVRKPGFSRTRKTGGAGGGLDIQQAVEPQAGQKRQVRGLSLSPVRRYSAARPLRGRLAESALEACLRAKDAAPAQGGAAGVRVRAW